MFIYYGGTMLVKSINNKFFFSMTPIMNYAIADNNT